MNKIIVSSKGINYLGESPLVINDRKIIFNESGNYEIEYTDNGNIMIEYEINNCDISLNISSFVTKLVVDNKYNIRNGKLVINKFYGDAMVDENLTFRLTEEGDRVDYNFSSISKNIDKYVINIIHENKNTVSNISNKLVVFGDGNIKVDVNSTVYKDCNKSKLDQNTRIVTMDNGKALVKPNMFIDLEDVEAKHGSVMGTFKEDQVFYLMSKGISYNEAIKLLIKGYIFSNVVVNVDERIKIFEMIDKYWR